MRQLRLVEDGSFGKLETFNQRAKKTSKVKDENDCPGLPPFDDESS